MKVDLISRLFEQRKLSRSEKFFTFFIHFLVVEEILHTESQNGWGWSSASCSRQGQYSRLLRIMSSWIMSSSQDRDAQPIITKAMWSKVWSPSEQKCFCFCLNSISCISVSDKSAIVSSIHCASLTWSPLVFYFSCSLLQTQLFQPFLVCQMLWSHSHLVNLHWNYNSMPLSLLHCLFTQSEIPNIVSLIFP